MLREADWIVAFEGMLHQFVDLLASAGIEIDSGQARIIAYDLSTETDVRQEIVLFQLAAGVTQGRTLIQAVALFRGGTRW